MAIGRRASGYPVWVIVLLVVLLAAAAYAMLSWGRISRFLPSHQKAERQEPASSATFIAESNGHRKIGFPVDPEKDLIQKRLAALERLLDKREQEQALRDKHPPKVPEVKAPEPKVASTPPAKTKIQVKPPDSLVYVAYTPPESPVSETYLGAGTVINCTLTTATNSERQVVVTAHVREHIRDSRNPDMILMPQYSTLILDTDPSQIIAGDERLDLHLASIRLPNRPAMEMPKEPVVDHIGQGGLPADVDRKWRYVLPAILLRGVFAASVEQVTTIGVAGVNGLQSAGNHMGQRVTQPFLNVRPTLRTSEADRCAVILTKDLPLPVYHF